jgi:invasion protein IalB
LGVICVLQAPALDRTVLVALLPPHKTIAPKPSYLLFQDDTPIKLTFLPDGTCQASGCYARAELVRDLLERIKAADAVSSGIEIPVMGRQVKLTFLPDGTCRASGCHARAELSESLLERIKAADAVSFGIEIPVMGRKISTPLAWRGLPEEITGAPATSAQDERQRWIRTYLPPALSDFLQ